MSREKIQDKCPWDLQPEHQENLRAEWTLVNGNDYVVFTKNQNDPNWFNINRNDEIFEQFMSYQARITYNELLDQGFTLVVL